jgi:uncharacterized protein (TIGR01370 family)
MKNNFKLKLAMLAAVFLGSISGAVARDVPAMPLTAVQSWNYLIANPAGKNFETILREAASEEYDMVVTDDLGSDGFSDPMPASAVAAFQNAKPGNIALAYIFISEFNPYSTKVRSRAEQATWVNANGTLTAAAPAWMTPMNPDFQNLYGVRFWYPEWKASVFSKIDQAIAGGWDGMMLDGLPAYQFKEGNNPWNYAEVVPDVDQRMATFLSEIYAYVRSKNIGRPFYIVGNNAHYLSNAAQIEPYLDATISEANIWSFSGAQQWWSTFSQLVNDIQPKISIYRNVGKPVFSVEYLRGIGYFESYATYLSYFGMIGTVTNGLQQHVHLEPQIFGNGTTSCITSIEVTFTQLCFIGSSTSIKAEDYMFNWGERAYADVLRSTNEPSAVTMGYYNRYYPQSQIYIGTKDNQLFYYQPNKEDGIVRLGKTSTWIQKALR